MKGAFGEISSCLLFTVLGLLSSISPVACHPHCRKHERNALLAFKDSLNDSMNSLSSWEGQDCCQWYGIECDNLTGSITKLNMGGMHVRALADSINPSLWELRNLEHLDLSFNNFSGVIISAELGLLDKLIYLDLSYSGFVGLVPWQLGNLSKLEHLGLSRDTFTISSAVPRVSDISWIQNLSALRYLSLNGVDLRSSSDTWADSISQLSELRYLGLSGCRLRGIIPLSLLNVTDLLHLDLSYNTFSSQQMPSWLSNMTSLVSLNLSGCALRGPIIEVPNLQELVLDRNYYLNVNTSAFASNNWAQLWRLSLSSCNLGGLITCSISRFSLLAHLDLSNNQIAGAIPNCIGKLQRLRFLDLSFNNLTGTVTYSLGNLSNIIHLDLRHNQLEGIIPVSLSGLTSLQYLGLGHNNLMGSIPEGFGLLSDLGTLDVSFNNFSDTISKTLFQGLYLLKVLHLSNSGLTVNMMDDTPPFSLEQLSLSSCNMQGSIPPWLSTQYRIVYLDLSNNRLNGNIPSWLWSLPNLAQVNLSSNNLEGSLPSYIHLKAQTGPRVADLHSNRLQGPLPLSFGSMEVLDLSNNHFNGTLSSQVFGNHWDINFLSLSNNNLSGELPKSLSESRSLEILDLSNNKISGDLHQRFGNCSSLVVLNMENNLLSGELPLELGNMPNLQTLHLNNNRLMGLLPSSLQNCKALEIVELGNNNISGSIPRWIKHLSRLRILILKNNHLQGSIPEEISLAKNIQILDLSQNNLSGFIPHAIGNFSGMVDQLQPKGPFILRYVIGFGMTMSPYKADAEDGLGLFYGADVEVMSKGQDMHFDQIPSIVTSIDLSNNNLVGHIPSEIGCLTGLVTLNLSRNNLNGSIPETLGSIKQLESLDLSSNQISGEIPTQLVNIDFLQDLNLSNNRLSGMIPLGRHFDTFDATSFLGNPDLCGILLNKSCGHPGHYESPVLAGEGGVDMGDLWWEIGVGLSYGFGFSCVITLLVVCEGWRGKVFKNFDDVIIALDKWLGIGG